MLSSIASGCNAPRAFLSGKQTPTGARFVRPLPSKVHCMVNQVDRHQDFLICNENFGEPMRFKRLRNPFFPLTAAERQTVDQRISDKEAKSARDVKDNLARVGKELEVSTEELKDVTAQSLAVQRECQRLRRASQKFKTQLGRKTKQLEEVKQKLLMGSWETAELLNLLQQTFEDLREAKAKLQVCRGGTGSPSLSREALEGMVRISQAAVADARLMQI